MRKHPRAVCGHPESVRPGGNGRYDGHASGHRFEKKIIALFGPTCAQEVELYGRGEKVVFHSLCSLLSAKMRGLSQLHGGHHPEEVMKKIKACYPDDFLSQATPEFHPRAWPSAAAAIYLALDRVDFNALGDSFRSANYFFLVPRAYPDYCLLHQGGRAGVICSCPPRRMSG